MVMMFIRDPLVLRGDSHQDHGGTNTIAGEMFVLVSCGSSVCFSSLQVIFRVPDDDCFLDDNFLQ